MAAGEMLANGRGGPPDVPRAIAFFHGAANAGHAGAYFALGILRADNPAEARQALRHAAAIGHPEARLMLERLPADA
jgi:TPR repeat protein